MKFEVLKRSYLKRNLIIGIIIVGIISAIVLNFTRAKYRTTQSIPLVSGTINYTQSDFELLSIYIKDDSGYIQTNSIPESGYILNEEESYCKVNNIRDDNISLSYDIESKTLNVTPMTTKATKCYLYFDEYIEPTINNILSNYNKSIRTDFSTPFTQNTTKTVYTSTDWLGTSYYFAGNPTDNWVYFGGFYWRIIRMNGDGSLRLIYNGNNTNTTGEETMISSAESFNTSYNRSEYVGIKYTPGNQHGSGTKSDILKMLETWYTNNLEDYSFYIDDNVGFCNDRNMASDSSWSSQPSTTINYAAYQRLRVTQSPSLDCPESSDIYKISIGLITADEVAYAGGVYATINDKFYLYNGQNYWTMTPYNYSYNIAYLFRMYTGGYLNNGVVYNTYGVRPVINLKATTTYNGSGTSDDPFVID